MDRIPDLNDMSIADTLAFIRRIYQVIAETMFLSRAANYAAFALVFYDWLICLDQEIQYFWKKKPSMVTGFYFLLRYFNTPMLGISALLFTAVKPTPQFCLNMMRFQAAGGIIIFTTTESLLTLRLYALYNQSKTILMFMSFVLLCALTGMTTVVGLLFARIEIVTRIMPGVPYEACIPTNSPSFWVWFWAAPLGFQTICFSLAIYQGYRSFLSWNGGFGARLFNVLMRDSIIYFIGIAAVETSTVILWLRGASTLRQATVGFALASCTILSSRLLLNLRAAAQRSNNLTSWGAPAGATDYPSTLSRSGSTRSQPDKYRHNTILHNTRTHAVGAVSIPEFNTSSLDHEMERWENDE